MGMMDGLKKATGVGLTHQEHYQRAFEKGVLLGPEKFLEAASMFDAAAQKAAAMGDPLLQTRAVANASLYRFIATGDRGALPDLRNALSQLADIEQIGTRNQMMPAPPVLAEVDARLAEYHIEQIPESDHRARCAAHMQTAQAFKGFFTSPLLTYRWQHSDAHMETAQSRFFLHTGLASWHEAKAAALTDPEAAAEHMAKALNAFRQCNDEQWVNETQAGLSGLRARRTCYVCHREMQGANVHFKRASSTTHPYSKFVLEGLGQDSASLDVERSEIILCTPCATAMEYVADRFAQQRALEVRNEMLGQIAALQTQVNALMARVNSIRLT